MHNKRKFGQPYQADLKQLSKELLIAKVKARETFLRSVLQNEVKPFTISINIIRKQLPAIRRKKSVRPDDIPGEILKLGGKQ